MPGPLQTFLLLQTLQRGLRGGLWVLPAPLLSDGPIIVVCLLVLSQAGQGLLRGLSLAGGLFLIYLARDSWLSLRCQDEQVDERVKSVAARHSGPTLMIRAATINALGPGPWVFWGTVIGPMLIQQWRVSAGHGLAFLGAFYATMLAVVAALMLLFAFARRLGPKVARAGTWLGIVLLLVFAALLILFGVGAIDRYSI